MKADLLDTHLRFFYCMILLVCIFYTFSQVRIILGNVISAIRIVVPERFLKLLRSSGHEESNVFYLQGVRGDRMQ